MVFAGTKKAPDPIPAGPSAIAGLAAIFPTTRLTGIVVSGRNLFFSVNGPKGETRTLAKLLLR
jgi:hypothetical protein